MGDPLPTSQVVKDLRANQGGVRVATTTQVKADGWGSLEGVFTYDGAFSAARLAINKDVDFCGRSPLTDESLVVGARGALANVVVICRSRNLPVHEDYAASADAVVNLDNDKCRFEPHVCLLRLSQTLRVRNPDPVAHNTNIQPPGDEGVNPILPATEEITHRFMRQQSTPFKVSCNIHPWMACYVLPRENPYAAVTDKDGKFKIANLPAGIELEFQVWHERGAGSGGALEAKEEWKRGRFKLIIPKDGSETLEVKVSPDAFR